MSYRDDREALIERLEVLERQVSRTEQLEQRVQELEQENRRLREAAGTGQAPATHATAEIYVDSKIGEYAASLVAATRAPHADLSEYILSGARPDAVEILLEAAKRCAVRAGRAYVTPRDIIEAAPEILIERVILTQRAVEDGVTVQAVIDRILELVEVP